MTTLNAKVILNVKTAAEWANSMEILLEGELGIESDTRLIKIGNGVDTYPNLPYTAASDINDIEGVTVTNPTEGNVLTYSNGEWVNITPSSLPADTDLSHYDNTTSEFITSSDIPALPADTDLSHYDNTNSDFATVSQIPTNVSELNNDIDYITSADLPTVGDGTITIQANSINIGDFTTNQNTNKTINITIPTNVSELNNDAGYVTSATVPTVNDGALIIRQDGNTIATFTANSATNVVANITSPSLSSYLPLSGGTMTGSIRISGSGFTLGDSTQEWSTVYTGQVNTNSNTLYVGGNSSSIFYFIPTSTATTNYLGSSNSSWSSGYIDSVYATNIKLTGALTVGIPSDVSAYKRITIKGYDGNTEGTLTDWAWLGWVNTGVFGFRPITSDTGTIGTRSEYWNKGYFTELHTSSIYSSYDAVNSVSKIDLYYNTNATESSPVQWGVMGQVSSNEIGIFPLVDNIYLGNSSNYWTGIYSTNIHLSSNVNLSPVASGNAMRLTWYDADNSKSRGLDLVGASFRPRNDTEISLGDQYGRWKDLHLFEGSSGGIYFGADTSHTYIRDVTSNTLVLNATANIQLLNNGTLRYNFANTSFTPRGTSNNIDLGGSGTGFRWNTVYYTTLNPTSDIRLKDNIVPLESGLMIVNDLDIKSFTYKNSPDHIEYGIIAQDVVEKYPELISVPKEDDGTYGTYLHNFIFVSLRAIQELSSKVDELNAKIKLLEGRV